MELSKSNLNSLSLLKKIPKSVHQELLSLIFGVLLQQADETEIEKSQSLKQIDSTLLKEVFSGLITIVIQAIKNNLNAKSLAQFLKDTNAPTEFVGLLSTAYGKTFQKIKEIHLETTGFYLKKLIDINWRMDYIIKSNKIEQIDKPVYFIDLNLQKKDGQIEKLKFSCDTNQLQDLVTTLKDAVLAKKTLK
ncbi:comm domain-containing protein [Anaeramoeba flamelloides]|uniref:COMM domain-containing protein 3 n=1 Tax=Anaeramoeba flamelloides TaxID=1746091 RepID=A0ABQ8XV82_9EUKA|nr:comm domain-containing protein [Anaeramoeba flamelloides]